MERYLGETTPKLGFGLMRLPMLGNDVDLEQTKALVDRFLEEGFTYFDTAYTYLNGKSEEAVGSCIVARHSRETYTITTKLPIWSLKEPKDMQRVLDDQLRRTRAEYFDYYLLHNLADDRIQRYEEIGAWEFLQSLKAKGIARHIGFSFHGTADELETLLTAHPEAEFVQLQINYADWDDPQIQSRLCYEVARKHHKPVLIMEPCKGGALAHLPVSMAEVLTRVNSDASQASWALRFAASLPGLIAVLSGMNAMEQMEENTRLLKAPGPMRQEELSALKVVAAALAKSPTIPCTGCRYCMEECPKGIKITEYIQLINQYRTYQNITGLNNRFNFIKRDGVSCRDCLHCGKCESRCPQRIKVMSLLEEVSRLF